MTQIDVEASAQIHKLHNALECMKFNHKMKERFPRSQFNWNWYYFLPNKHTHAHVAHTFCPPFDRNEHEIQTPTAEGERGKMYCNVMLLRAWICVFLRFVCEFSQSLVSPSRVRGKRKKKQRVCVWYYFRIKETKIIFSLCARVLTIENKQATIKLQSGRPTRFEIWIQT